MERLKQQVKKLYCINHPNQERFIPHESLYQLLTKDAIENALLEDNIEEEILHETASEVAFRARKIFSILLFNNEVPLIRRFIETDELQPGDLDPKLPFELEHLKKILPEQAAEDFFHNQWEFAVPVFSGKVITRALHPKTRLPFIRSFKRGKGAFGTVYSIDVHPQHWKYEQIPHSKVVRKQISTQSDPEVEHSNLALLKTADHPNIVEMLGSYVMGDYQNILFREITGGDLGELLDGSQEHDFGSSQDFLNALAGLASAITTVHHLTPQNSRLIRNGFHHDLKPGNILVDGKNFILSDFGLARFKLSDETSETAQKPIGDFYLAPECIDLLDTSRTCFVRRSSDIWSFGCIIAEVLTYMIGGTSGVQNFKTARRYKIGHHVRYDFHSGPEPNSGVQKWLAGLKNQATVSSSEIDPTALTELVSLIEGILNPEPRSRPKAPAVEASLCLVALGAKVREIMRSYQDVLASELYRNSIEASIEAARFESIWWAIGLDTRVLPEANSGIAGEPETDFIVTQFGTLLRLLEREKGAFDVLRPFVETPTSPPFIEVKQSNKRILNLLPPALPEKVDAFLKLNLLQHQNSSFLQDIEDALREEPTNEKLLALVTMRKLDIILKENTHSTQCILDPKPKLDDDGIGDKRTGRLPQSATRVLVEFKSYRNWHDRESDVHQRVAAFVQRFSASDLPESLRTLRCIGFYHEPAENSLGIAYEFPSIRPEVRVTTLWQLLADDKAARDRKAAKERPSLRSRFDLGYRLASSVYELHSLHWLHKSISSFNIVFFTGPTSSIGQISQCIEQPYLVGFEHSRPDEERAFSSQLPKERLEYHHPDFINGSRYRSEFDYYSLGIVLLEIALWKSVSEITKGESWRLPWHAFRERLLVNVVPQVEFYVGPEYRDVVSELFRIGSYDDQREMIPTLLSRDFQHKVVSRLRRLNV